MSDFYGLSAPLQWLTLAVDVPASRVLRWPTSVSVRSRADRPSLQPRNRGEPLLEDRTQPHFSQAVRIQGRADRAWTWRALQFVQFRESPISAALPPAPRVYGASRELPATPALDVIHSSWRLCFSSPRLQGQRSQLFHQHRGSRRVVFVSGSHSQSIFYHIHNCLTPAWCAVTLESNITRLDFRYSLPARIRAEG
jgi:hypothetical protein